MNRIPRFRVLDVFLSGLKYDDAVDNVIRMAGDGGRHYVCVFAVDSILKCHADERLARIANSSDMTLCDGMPLVMLGRKAAHVEMSRCYGPDVMLGVSDRGRAAGLRHFYYGGASEEITDALESNLKAKFPGLSVVGKYVPPFRELTPEEEDGVVECINASGADVVWVGVGTPKQDFWMDRFRGRLNAGVLVAVGAAFNFHAGAVRQAPSWMQRVGMEWFFRLLAEPGRLWKRYLIGNPYFIALLLKQMATGKPGRLGEIRQD